MSAEAPWLRRMPSPLRAAGSAVVAYLTRIFVDPVRGGRLRDVDWPVGLRPIVVVAIVGYGVAAALILLGPQLRALLDLTAQGTIPSLVAVPDALDWLIFALTALSLSLAVSGALHARAWLRWLIVGVVALALAFVGIGFGGDPVAAAVTGVCVVGLVVLTAVRGHRAFAWGEFVVIAVLVHAPLVVALAVLARDARPYGVDYALILLSIVLGAVGQLAVPAAFAAGASLAKFAVSSAIWAAQTIRDKLGPTAVLVVLGAVALWRLVDLVLAGVTASAAGWTEPAVDGPAPVWALGGAVALLAVTALVWGLLRLLRRRPGAPSASGMLDRVDLVVLVVAAATTTTIVSVTAQLLGQVLLVLGLPAASDALFGVRAVTNDTGVIAEVRLVGGVVLLLLAGVQAARGRRTLPELLAVLGIATVLLSATRLAAFPLIWTGDALAAVGAVLALAVLAVLLLRRRLTAESGMPVLVALLISALFAYRDAVSNPISLLLGFSALVLTAFGFVWSFLTGYGRANGDSPRYPRPARVQLVLANALFAITVLAFAVLARDPDAGTDFGGYAGYGTQAYGDPLLAAGLLIALVAAATGGSVDPPGSEEGPDEPTCAESGAAGPADTDASAQNAGTSTRSSGEAARADAIAAATDPEPPSTRVE